jgi:VIT1/CCC1 family predicted Fe2+/Mn2+ transporter
VGSREAPARRRRRRPGAGDLTKRSVAEPAEFDARHLDREWLAQHIADERKEAEWLGEIREALFGMQDGLVSTLAVVSTVGAASGDRFAVLIAGIASALAGVFSMAAGEYLSSKSQREIYVAQIENEREEVRDRPAEAEAEVAYMLEQEGLSEAAARRVAAELAREPTVLLKTMVEKELGLVIEEGAGPFQGALVMGGAFGIASLVPIFPYLFLPIGIAPLASLILCTAVVFVIGAVKTRWTKVNPVRSGLEVVALAAFAGIAGYLFGSVLPSVLGVAGLGPV